MTTCGIGGSLSGSASTRSGSSVGVTTGLRSTHSARPVSGCGTPRNVGGEPVANFDAVRAAERAVLGALLASADVIGDVMPILAGPGDFYDPVNGMVYRAILAQHAAGDPVDPVTVATRLAGTDDLGRVGGGAFLAELMESCPVPRTAPHYAREVRRAAEGRALVEYAARLSNAAEMDDPEHRAAVVADVRERLGGAAGGTTQDIDSWTPLDLGPYLRGEVESPEPSRGIARSDGLCLLYPGKEHAAIGEMESGKTWWCLACVAAEMASDRAVLYVHFEESDPSGTVERLQALGCPDWQVLKLFRFVAPARPVTADALGRLLDPVPSLVVFDGVNEAMSLHGWDIRDEKGAASFRRHLVRPCTAVGAAALSADHVVKDPEKRGRNALGSIHKGNGLDGALILLENADPFGRGRRGRSHVFITKDRPGYLRRHGNPTRTPGKTFMGELVVDDSQTSGPDLYVNFWAPKPALSAAEMAAAREAAGNPDDAVILKTVRTITAKKLPANLRTIRGLAGFGKDKVDDALGRLLVAGVLVEHSGPRNARVFTVAEDHSSRGGS